MYLHFRQFLWMTGLLLALSGLTLASSEWVYTAVEGDNLWTISERHLDTPLRYEQLRKINGIERPRRMPPGTLVRIPMKWIRSNPVSAKIIERRGDLTLLRHDGTNTDDVDVGIELRLGDRLQTQAKSSVAVRFADGTIVTLHQNGEMRFDHLTAHGTTGMVDSRLRLLKGRIETEVKPAVGPGSRFEIHTPSAISAVRGTDYRAATTQDGSLSNIEVTGGRVAVTGKGRSRIVPAGFGTQVAKDSPPKQPRPLLDAPDTAPYPTPIRQTSFALTWEPLQLAERYRVQIAAAESPNVVLRDERVTGPRYRIPQLDDGRYILAIRGIDRDGLEGRDRELAVLLDAQPQPPVQLSPREAAVIRGAAAELRWTASAEAAQYILEIAADAAFSEVVLRENDLTATRWQTDDAMAAPGTYYWRLTSVAADGEVGPAGETRNWIAKDIPPGVEPELTGDDELLTASWPDAGDNVQYQVQLAHVPSFAELEIDRNVTSPSISFPPMPAQVRYLRIRIIEDDGYVGPWGAVQRVDPPPDPTRWYIPILGLIGILLL